MERRGDRNVGHCAASGAAAGRRGRGLGLARREPLGRRRRRHVREPATSILGAGEHSSPPHTLVCAASSAPAGGVRAQQVAKRRRGTRWPPPSASPTLVMWARDWGTGPVRSRSWPLWTRRCWPSLPSAWWALLRGYARARWRGARALSSSTWRTYWRRRPLRRYGRSPPPQPGPWRSVRLRHPPPVHARRRPRLQR